MKCHEIDYKIFGDDMQMVEVELDNGETVIAEAGAMNFMDDGITFESRHRVYRRLYSGNRLFD